MRILSKTKARWLRFWHCFHQASMLRTGHEMVDESVLIIRKIPFIKRKFHVTTRAFYIGCECGKSFYGKTLTDWKKWRDKK